MNRNIKVIILAAGRGTRLNKYTSDMPKGMLEVFGRPILRHQVETYRSLGITDISIVTGYHQEKIDIEGVSYFHNPDYSTTNMVESLFCAEEKLDGDVIISYADIVFSKKVLQCVLSSKMEIGVLADKSWKEYWVKRYGRFDFDIESFSVNSEDAIMNLGDDVDNLDAIDGRYVGMIKLSENGVNTFKQKYTEYKSKYAGRIWMGGRVFELAYMTDFIQSIINSKHTVNPIWINGGWVEFDTNRDYELVVENKLWFGHIFEQNL
jgi:choline kinase